MSGSDESESASVRGELRIVADRSALADLAAREIVVRANDAVARRGRFDVALAGGSTPRDLYRRLATSPVREQIPWHATHVFWGDERSVPPEHADSNFRMAREELLDRVSIPAGQIHRIPTEEREPALVARSYQRTITAALDAALTRVPRFDLALLGLGADGHTASLFPGTGAVWVDDAWVIAVHVPQLGVDRISLTVPILNAARTVLFLVAGADKADALARAITLEPTSGVDLDACPARAIQPSDGELLWFVDAAAAARIEATNHNRSS